MLPLQGARVQSLVEELRSHVTHGKDQKKKKVRFKMNIPWWTGVVVIHSMCVYVWEGGGTGRSVRAAVGSNAGRRGGASGMIAGIRIVEIWMDAPPWRALLKIPRSLEFVTVEKHTRIISERISWLYFFLVYRVFLSLNGSWILSDLFLYLLRWSCDFCPSFYWYGGTHWLTFIYWINLAFLG